MWRLRADSDAAYLRFLKRVRDNGVLWHIRITDSDEPLTCPSWEHEGAEVFPFWSAEAYARRNCADLDFEVFVEAIQLPRFMEYWLPKMMEDGIIAGPDWDRNFAGREITANDLALALTQPQG